ncbi:MAG TPA: DoxX family protein [Sulfurovum sp.]|nr:DoxX family protein [Sulfurovum sp.]
MRNVMAEISVLFSYPRHIIFLIIRLLLAYGFAKPALLKISNIQSTIEWFQSVSIPLPQLFAYLVSGIEIIGIVLLILGLFTRQISVLLSFVMLGAIFFVHWEHGFSVANNGFEIPLYYLLFLLLFATFGAGKYSLDHLFFKDGNYE